MKNLHNKNKGFTLIETMITVTVIGALTALAVPAYQDYTIKSQVAEAFVATEALKKEVINQKSLTDSFNKDLVKIDSETLKINDNGNVSYIFKNKNKEINNKMVMFILDDSNTSSYKWNCVTDVNSKYLPSSVECAVDEDEYQDNNEFDERDYSTVNHVNHFVANELNMTFFKHNKNEKDNEILEIFLLMSNQGVAEYSIFSTKDGVKTLVENRDTHYNPENFISQNDFLMFLNDLNKDVFTIKNNDYKIKNDESSRQQLQSFYDRLRQTQFCIMNVCDF